MIFLGMDLKLLKNFINKRLDCLFASVQKQKVYHGYLDKIHYKFNIFPSHSVGFFLKKSMIGLVL